MIIGLTGMYCAGKNHIAALLQKQGFPVLDIDTLGHGVIESKKQEIIARFGNDIQKTDNTVDRRRLGAKVFGKKDELAALEAIIHPEVNRLTMQWIETRNAEHCVLNAAVLHKSAVFEKLDRIILVSAPRLIRLIRAKKRDKLPWTVLMKRLSSQKQFSTQYLAGNADIYRVENCCLSETETEQRIDAILTEAGLIFYRDETTQGGF